MPSNICFPVVEVIVPWFSFAVAMLIIVGVGGGKNNEGEGEGECVVKGGN